MFCILTFLLFFFSNELKTIRLSIQSYRIYIVLPHTSRTLLSTTKTTTPRSLGPHPPAQPVANVRRPYIFATPSPRATSNNMIGFSPPYRTERPRHYQSTTVLYSTVLPIVKQSRNRSFMFDCVNPLRSVAAKCTRSLENHYLVESPNALRSTSQPPCKSFAINVNCSYNTIDTVVTV